MSNEQKQAFCENCKYLGMGVGDNVDIYVCLHPRDLKKVVNWYGKIDRCIQLPSEKNANNDCQDYESDNE